MDEIDIAGLMEHFKPCPAHPVSAVTTKIPKVKQPVIERPEEGSVWHGPWHSGLVRGVFGTQQNQHFAITLRQIRQLSAGLRCFRFFPVTSKPSKKALLVLPNGALPGAVKTKQSYVLDIILMVGEKDLFRRFSDKGLISSQYIDMLHQKVHDKQNRFGEMK